MPIEIQSRIRFTLHSILRWSTILGFVWAMVCGDGLSARQARPGEYPVKAAYLLNFGKFVTWSEETPAGRSDSVSICVIGRDPFGPVLDMTVFGETIGGKAVMTRRVSEPSEVEGCRILFISSSESRRLPEILNSIDDFGVLTVSDISKFSSRGGMIEFILQDNRVRFEISLNTAQMARLTLSSELLRVAANVRKNP